MPVTVSAAGRTVTVIAERIRSKQAGPVADKPFPILRFGGPRPWRRWRKRTCIARIVKQRGAGIAGIFADSWKSIEALPAGLALPVSVLAHGMEYPLNASGSKRRRICDALARCSAVIANSRYTADLVRPYLAGRTDKLQTVLPPVLPPAEADAGALAAIKSRTAGRRPLLATVARLEPRKGIDAVIRAMPEVRRAHPGCLYAVAGGGADRARLEELAQTLGVRDERAVPGPGQRGGEGRAASQADVFAMPVRREGASVEGFGIGYGEAAWFGVPSLAGREGGAGDAVLDGETGLVCDGAKQDDVASALLTLLGDEALRKRLGAAAAERVRRDLSWPSAIGRYLATFEAAR